MNGGGGRPKMEPNADLRTFANFQRQMFVALTDEGFTESQALQIIGTTIAAAFLAGGSGGDP